MCVCVPQVCLHVYVHAAHGSNLPFRSLPDRWRPLLLPASPPAPLWPRVRGLHLSRAHRWGCCRVRGSVSALGSVGQAEVPGPSHPLLYKRPYCSPQRRPTFTSHIPFTLRGKRTLVCLMVYKGLELVVVYYLKKSPLFLFYYSKKHNQNSTFILSLPFTWTKTKTNMCGLFSLRKK